MIQCNRCLRMCDEDVLSECILCGLVYCGLRSCIPCTCEEHVSTIADETVSRLSLASHPCMSWSKDAKHRFITADEVIHEMFGQNVTGKKASEMQGTLLALTIESYERLAMRTMLPVEVVVDVNFKVGVVTQVLVRMTPVESGGITLIFGTGVKLGDMNADLIVKTQPSLRSSCVSWLN